MPACYEPLGEHVDDPLDAAVQSRRNWQLGIRSQRDPQTAKFLRHAPPRDEYRNNEKEELFGLHPVPFEPLPRLSGPGEILLIGVSRIAIPSSDL
jgi:hypothetical protein